MGLVFLFGCSAREPDGGLLQPEPRSHHRIDAPAAAPTSLPLPTAVPSAAQTVASVLAVDDSAPPGFVPIPSSRKKGFPGVEFSKVRAYAFDLQVSDRPVCEMPLDDDGRLCSTVARPGVELSQPQVDRLMAIVSKRGTYGEGSSCFLPHHGFVFYDKSDVPVAALSVCFLCDVAEAVPTIPLAKRVEGGLGLSKKGTEELRALCREVGLAKCDAKSPDEFGRLDRVNQTTPIRLGF